jgi:carbon storage regulator CsrA
MLIITRKSGEAVRIGDIRVVVARAKGAIRLGIEAPKTTPIWREEVEANRQDISKSSEDEKPSQS